MNVFIEQVLLALPTLLVGILGGQKVRITLGGKTLPVTVPSRKVTGKSRKLKTDPPSARSDSLPDVELPYMVDPVS